MLAWKPLLPYGIIGALVIALVMTCGDETPEPILSDETKAAIEREMGAVVRAAFQREMDSLRQLGRASVDTSILREESARTSHRRADTHGRDADQARVAVVRAATLTDSLAFMQVAYEERSQEVNALRMAFDTLASSLLLARRAAEVATTRADAAEERVHALEVLNQRILDDVAKAQKGCEILGLVRCPTRKEAFVLGVVTGAAAGFAAAR